MDSTEKTIQAYEQSAEAYAGKFMDYAPYRRRVQAFAALLKAGDRVLDLGCGPGNVLKQVVESVGSLSVTGVDLSAAMLRLARENVPSGRFILQDLRDLRMADGDQYDAVILSFCIVHLSHAEAEALLRKATALLKEGGLLYLSFMEGKAAGYESTSFSKETFYFNYHSSEEMGCQLDAYGIFRLETSFQDYPEADGSVTKDVFIVGRKDEAGGVTSDCPFAVHGHVEQEGQPAEPAFAECLPADV